MSESKEPTGFFFPIPALFDYSFLLSFYYYSYYRHKTPARTEVPELNSDENEAKAFLASYNKEYAPLLNRFTVATWNWETNLTDYNANIAVS